MSVWSLAYDLCEKRLRGESARGSIPRHIGAILDGNRRWAKSIGIQASQGHRTGADKISEFFGRADEIGVEIVTLWMLLTDNLSRPSEELDELLRIIADAVDHLTAQKWCLAVVGDLDLLPEAIAECIRLAVASISSRNTMRVNTVVDYGGRHEITEAVHQIIPDAATREISLERLANTLTDADITDHLYTKNQPDLDLVVRTSGGQRLSGFMIWQPVHSEFHFCEAYWPDPRRADFLRIMRSYGQRERRPGR